MESQESIDSPKNPAPRLKVVPPNQIKPLTSSPAAQKLPVPAQLPTQPEATLPIPQNGGSGGDGGSSKTQNVLNKIPHSLIMVGSIAAVLAVIGMYPLNYSIKPISAAAEPNPDPTKVRKLSAHQGSIVKEISETRELKKGDVVISTVDPQQEEKFRKIENDISDAQSQKRSAQEEESTKRRELEQANSGYRSAVNSLEQSQRALAISPIMAVHEAKINKLRQEQSSLGAQLASKQGILAKYKELESEGGMGRIPVINIEIEVSQIEGRISSLEAEMLQVEAEKSVAVEQLLKRVQEDSDRVTEKGAAQDTAEQELNRSSQKVREFDIKINQLEKEKAYQKDQKEAQTLLAPFDGVAELKEIQGYLDQKLPKSIDVFYYSPNDMMAKLEVDQIDHCQLQKVENVTFVPNGGIEYKGKIYRIENEIKVNPNNPSQRSATVWIKLDNPNSELTMGMTGQAALNLGQEQIYKIVWRELYKLVAPFQSIPDVRTCK